jgi:hypothetical protein
MTNNKFRFWVNYLKLISLFFALMGVFWAVAGMFDPFGIYDRLLAETLFGQEQMPDEAKITFRFILGPLGATCAGYFLMQFYIAKFAFANGFQWGYRAVVIPFLVWFVIDKGMCIIHRAWFNIYLANIPALAAMIPVFATYRYFRPDKQEHPL